MRAGRSFFLERFLNEWIQVFGRFHPVALHMPIGMLASVVAVEGVVMFRRGPATDATTDRTWVAVACFLAVLAAAAAVFAAVTGYVLSLSGGYEGGPVELHRNLGISVAVAAVLTAAAYFYRASPWPRRAALALCMACLLPAGHLGATMTHGENFLFAPLDHQPKPRPRPSTPGDIARQNGARQASHGASGDTTEAGQLAKRTQFDTVVAPILAARCTSCHGPTKQKGDLTLHTAEGITKGGEFGPVLVPGDAKGSELVVRLRLPIDDEDHMPPDGKTQPTEQEISAIEAWITSGASFTAAATPGPAPAVTPVDSPTDAPKGVSESKPRSDPAVLPIAAIDDLRAKFINVAPVAQSSGLFVVDTAAVAASVDDEMVRSLLTPLRDVLADLSLARTKATDASLPLLAEFASLRRLDLRGTAISDAGLASLRASKSLEELVLSQTRLDDGAVEALLQMASLRRVYLWKSGLTPSAIDRLRAERPNLFVDAGDRSVTTIAATEAEVKLSGDAPPLGQAPPTPSQATLTPINTVCPVSGSPIVAKYSIVYEGKVIGFCCPNCPKEFWADPAKFESKLR